MALSKSYVLILSLLIVAESASVQCNPNDKGSCSDSGSDSGSLLQSKLTYASMQAGESDEGTNGARDGVKEGVRRGDPEGVGTPFEEEDQIVEDSVLFAADTLQAKTAKCGGSKVVGAVVKLSAEMQIVDGVSVIMTCAISDVSGLQTVYHTLTVRWEAGSHEISKFSHEGYDDSLGPVLVLPMENDVHLTWCNVLSSSSEMSLQQLAMNEGHDAVERYQKMLGYLGRPDDENNPDSLLEIRKADCFPPVTWGNCNSACIASPTSEDCATSGGDANGAACHFPFTYKGVEYNECTDIDHNQFWCNTSPDPPPMPAEYNLRYHDTYKECFAPAAVNNQGGCGSCWAFAAAHVATARLCMQDPADIINAGGARKFVSVQQVLSCNEGGSGCDGGWMSTADRLWQRDGVALASDYEYKPKYGGSPWDALGRSCQWENVVKPYIVESYYGVARDVGAMQAEIFCNGPIGVAFQVWSNSFGWKSQDSGVYAKTDGSKSGGHAVVAVGWGALNGTDYWEIMNSWGSYWGDGGFIKFKRGSNLAGIESSWGNSASKLKKASASWMYDNWGACNVTSDGKTRKSRGIKCVQLESSLYQPQTPFGECDTHGGNAGGAPCSFPFTYDGMQYNGCIDLGNNGVHWCYTATTNMGGSLTWGNCDSTCPIYTYLPAPESSCPQSDGWPNKATFPCQVGKCGSDAHPAEKEPMGSMDCGGGNECNAAFCNGHGEATDIGGQCVCTCDTAYHGDNCHECAASYEGYPDCKLSCTRESDCSGHGDASGVKWKNEFDAWIDDSCSCDCDLGWTGLDCETATSAPTTIAPTPAPTTAVPTPAPTECTTTGGDAGGAACSFPFEYKGAVYNGCTDVNNKGAFWCYTTIPDRWGNCDSACPHHTPPTTTPAPTTLAPTPAPTTAVPTPAPTECTTTGGDAGGAACSFPFEYKGAVYNGCTDVNNKGAFWCYTTIPGRWGNCDSACPHHIHPTTTPAPTTLAPTPAPTTAVPTPAPTECTTTGGDAGGAACSFPFEYKGAVYNGCTDVNNKGAFWCYTTIPGKWGNCDSACPRQ